MIDPDIVYRHIDQCVAKGYLTYTSEKEFALENSLVLLYLKIHAMSTGQAFPAINTYTVKGTDTPLLYVTDTGETFFLTTLTGLSDKLFETVAPLYKAHFSPRTFVFSNTATYKNFKGTHGRRKLKSPMNVTTYHVLVDNSAPYDYLKSEYIFDTIREGRQFIYKLLMYLPPNLLEFIARRVSKKTQAVRKEVLPLIIEKRVKH